MALTKSAWYTEIWSFSPNDVMKLWKARRLLRVVSGLLIAVGFVGALPLDLDHGLTLWTASLAVGFLILLVQTATLGDLVGRTLAVADEQGRVRFAVRTVLVADKAGDNGEGTAPSPRNRHYAVELRLLDAEGNDRIHLGVVDGKPERLGSGTLFDDGAVTIRVADSLGRLRGRLIVDGSTDARWVTYDSAGEEERL